MPQKLSKTPRHSKTPKQSKAQWTDAEKSCLEREARSLESKLGRPLRSNDLRRVKLPRRSFLAVKSQAARMGLYQPTRKITRWTAREEQILLLLTRERGLGARRIKTRGFFSTASEASSWSERSVDSIAQKKRRAGLVDPERSRRARFARHLGPDERRRLRAELRENPQGLSTEEFARRYEVAPSTIRRYRKKWRIRQTWHDSMSLRSALERRETLAEETRERNLGLWAMRKEALRDSLAKRRTQLSANGRKAPELRCCERCGEEWPATEEFFAPSPKRRGGRIVARYLRRSCRVCPRRANAH